MFGTAMEHNLDQIRRSIAKASQGREIKMLDLGCWDGANTLAVAPPNAELHGIELSDAGAELARANGITVEQSDLNASFPYEDNSFDVVTSNQVIEHLADTDLFVSEGVRVAKPGGVVVASTENMSSWHNLFALTFGWQAFSLTNVSEKANGVGNPISLLRDTEPLQKGYQHLRIFSYRGLKELFEAHGLINVRVVGAGYYPLPSKVANFDPRHAAFITVIGTKP